MNVWKPPLAGLLVFEPVIRADDRGTFTETFQAKRYADAGLAASFVQDNWTTSLRGTLRGLHLQWPMPQGKLVWCPRGLVWDVAVDVRRGSPQFGRWFGVELSGASKRQLWIPPGFAHGFCVLSEGADVAYKCTDFYAPQHSLAIRWDDPQLGVDWPISAPLLSKADTEAPGLKEIADLPRYS